MRNGYQLRRLRRSLVDPARLVLMAGLVAVTACGPMEVRVPRVTSPSSGKHQYGKFVWFDLATSDVAAAKGFYGPLFGWTFSDLAEGHDRYTVIENRYQMIGGIFDTEHPDVEGGAALWIGSISVPDVSSTTQQTRNAGGTVHDAPYELRDRGITSLVSDPQGATVAFLRSSGGDPPDREPAPGNFAWIELWTPDLAGSLSFYVSLGYTAGGLQIRGDEPYRILKVADEPQAGVVELERGDAGAGWLPYVAVDDLAATLEKVVELGGQVVVDPDPEFAEGRAAVIVDPTGAALAVAVIE
jgi:predicted enzyme related to lactoylglutathione lyase